MVQLLARNTKGSFISVYYVSLALSLSLCGKILNTSNQHLSFQCDQALFVMHNHT